ncbi:MAG: hypothetical protein U5K38_01750 [Woeseiaceae bacterium]|nr:hypothetical protein [Woeseiaceae bacterium]
MLQTSTRFLDEHVECEDSAVKQDALINPYFDEALRMLMNAMSAVSEGEDAEQAVIAAGAAGIRTTATVDFYTGKQPYNVLKCHLSGAVYDSDWERQSARGTGRKSLLVRAWVKNDRLGLAVPYRKDGASRKYLPDFIIETTDGEFLMIEIKGQLGRRAAQEGCCRAMVPGCHEGQKIWQVDLLSMFWRPRARKSTP